jgi:muramidase (phage lysozyme)
VTPNLKAFLDMIAVSEIGKKLLRESDNGYNVKVGGTLFFGYQDHPRTVVKLRPNLSSSAAGRYQILMHIFGHYKAQLGLPDFSPDSQDKIAIQLIRECKALEDIEAGRFDEAVFKCRSRWASLPGANYNQHENDIEYLRTTFVKAGGTLTGATHV